MKRQIFISWWRSTLCLTIDTKPIFWTYLVNLVAFGIGTKIVNIGTIDDQHEDGGLGRSPKLENEADEI